jgi:hypothetical protein
MFNMNYFLSQLLEVDVHLDQQHTKHISLSVTHYEEPPTYISPIMSVLSGLRGCLWEMKSLINKPGLPAITALRPDSISIAEIKHPGPVDRTQQKIILTPLLPLFLIGGSGHKPKGCRWLITICLKD